MTIAKLLSRGNNVLISFEDGTNVLVDYDFLMNRNFKPGDDITDELYSEIIERGMFLEVRNSALRFLSRRNHSRGELELKLRKKAMPAHLIETALNELVEKKFINDIDFTQKFTEEKLFRKKWGLAKITASLRAKKVEEEIIQQAVKIYHSDERIIKNAEKLAERKLKFYRDKNLTELQLKQKLFAFLMSRGFSSSESKSSIDKILREK